MHKEMLSATYYILVFWPVCIVIVSLAGGGFYLYGQTQIVVFNFEQMGVSGRRR